MFLHSNYTLIDYYIYDTSLLQAMNSTAPDYPDEYLMLVLDHSGKLDYLDQLPYLLLL